MAALAAEKGRCASINQIDSTIGDEDGIRISRAGNQSALEAFMKSEVVDDSREALRGRSGMRHHQMGGLDSPTDLIL